MKSANSSSCLSSDDLKMRKKKFTKEEDERLKFLVGKLGSKKWEEISNYMPGRSGRQCRDRYQNYLTPEFFNGQWTQQEDELLFSLFQEHGSKWSKMTCFFKRRSANALKNRWNYYISKHLKDEPFQNLINNKDEKVEDEDDLIENFLDYSSFDFIDFESMNEKEEFTDVL